MGSLIMLAAGIASAADFNGWQKKMPVTFSGYTRAEALTNYPALVVLSTNLNGFSYTDFLSTNADLRFTDSTQTNELNYEVERWDTNGSSYIWVQVPLLTSNASIQAFWGMSGQTAPAYTTNGAVWTNGFKGVWHMGQTNAQDSAVLASPGVSVGNVTVAGFIGSAQSFNGTSAYIDSIGTVGSYAFVQTTGVFTVSCWAKLASNTANSAFALLGNTPGASLDHGFFLAWENRTVVSTTNALRMDLVKGQSGVPVISSLSTTNAIADTNWHYVTAVGNGANITFWVDGSPWGGSGTMGTKSTSASTRTLNFGRVNHTASYLWYPGLLDEIRVENVARSSNWVWACRQTMASNATFNTYGAAAPANPNLPQISNIGAQNLSTTSAEVMGRLITNGTSATTVTLYWSTTDGRTNASDWTTGGSASNLGTQAAGATFTNALTGLTPDTTYYWNYRAVNDSGTVWAATAGSPSFKTRPDFSTWQKQMKITFAGYNRTETLANFPALVVLSTNLSGFSYGDFLSLTNQDLRFTASDGTTELNYEIEKWDTNGASYVWIQVTNLVDSNTFVRAYWGKSGLTAPAYTTNGAVWSQGFSGVYHFRQGSPAPDLRDSSPNAYHGLNSNTTSTATGRVGYAASFPGVNQFVTLTNANKYLPLINTPITVSTWFKANEIPVASLDDRIFTFARYSGSSGFSVGLGNANQLQMFRANASGVGTPTDFAMVASNGWYHTAIAFNGSQFACYLNGSLLTNVTDSLTNNDAAVKAYIGGGPAGNGVNAFNGIMDEFQISSVARSSNWLWACYMSQASNSAFNTYGAAAAPANPNLPQISNIGTQNLSNTSADVVATLSSSGGSAATVYLHRSTTDGRTNASDWTAGGGSVSNLGVKAEGATFTNTLAGLAPNTTYYWNHSAVNASGTVWAATTGSPSFKTFGPPGVNNGGGATDVNQPFGATLNGNLTNGTTAHVYILLGTNDGVWTVTNDLSTLTEGPFSRPVNGLTAGTPYYYTCYATNAYGSALATPSAVFTTRLGTIYYWVGAANANWSVASSWAATSGGAPGAGIPGAMDDVIFDAGGVSNAVVDAAFAGTVYAVTVGTGYTGTNTQKRNLSVAGNFSLLRGAWRFTAGTAAALSVGNDMVVSNATVFCERVSTAGQGTGRVFSVGGSLTIATNGAFNADALGFDAKGGPGAGAYRPGGSHGGQGGATYEFSSELSKVPYGSITAPVSLGSGGDGKTGGGAIALLVTNQVAIQAGGRITAIGGGGDFGAGGSGGSVYIRSRSMTGSGLISVDGGSTTGCGGGGGGRIALVLSEGTSVDRILCRAYGGGGGAWWGAAGTLYIQLAGQADGAGTLILDNANNHPNFAKTMLRSGEDWSGFAAVIITNRADVGVYTNVNLSAVKFVGNGAAASFITVRAPNVGIVYPNDWTISNFTLIADTPITLSGNVTVATSGVITHSPHAWNYQTYRMDVTVTGDLTVLGQIHADNRGFPNRSGPAPAMYKHGAAHGGDRGVGAGDTDPIVGMPYGSVTNPTTLGSGGDGLQGGGAIRLTVPGSLTVGASGVISACGSVPYEYGGSGAGGSIWITAGALAGSGTVKANGGIGGSASPNGGGLAGGGGGRVSVWSTSGDFGSVTFQAYGGYEDTAADGGAGTVYLRGAEEYGRLIVDNASYDAAARTLIVSNVTGTVVGDIRMRNRGNVTLGTNATLTVFGSWTNDATSTFVAQTNSTVIFAGTNAATVYGNRTYYNLTATNSTRTLYFEAGKTNTVLGALAFDNVTLLSTVDGAWWYLTQATNAPQSIPSVTVKDSNAGGGQELRADRGDSLGHNVNWWFPPTGPSLLLNIGAQNVSNTSADVVATLVSGGGSATTVYLYWSTMDGTTNASTWTTGGSVSNLGVKADGATFTNTLAGLTPNTTYYWNHSAVNASGTVWAVTTGSPSFKTYGPPAVNNGGGATDVNQPFGATLNGNLTNGVAAHVYLLLGTNDGVWTVTNDLATLTEGPFSRPVSGLTAATRYYYTSYATNAYGSALATPSVVFTTRQGSVYYWVGAANANWSAPGSWAATSGGAPGAGVPGALDDAIFDAGGVSNAVVDAAFPGTVYSVIVGTGYTGTNTQNRNLSVAQDYRLLNGAWRFTAGTAAALSVGNDMVVSNATVYCERVSITGEGTGRVFSVGGSLTVATNGAFNADGLGFDYRNGPGGAGTGNYSQSGGSHGGEGGGTYWSTSLKPKLPYGSITAPLSLGSGGDDTTAKGGGAIALFVTNDVTIQAGGRIRANGIGDTYFAGAAGGSIYIRCRSLAGAGLILADGGSTTGNGGGSGGRIAVILSAGAGVDQIACHAYGGVGGSGYYGHGAAGTVYIQTAAQAEGAGTLILDNANRRSNYPKTLLRSGEDWSGFAAVIITNQADVGVYTNVNLSSVKFVGYGAARSFISVRAPATGLTFPANWVISNFTLVADAPITLPGDVTVATNSAITHSPHEDGTAVYRLDLTATNLTVYGVVHADNRGFPGAPAGLTQGRGPAPADYKHGAAHGGDRGVAAGDTDPIVGLPYGSLTNPTTLGSGGNGLPGGGAIRLTVPGTLTVGASAAISACGSVPYEYGGSGAGGSIWITAGTLAGSGTVKANGGTGGSASANGGGQAGGSGGRVSVWATSGDFGAISFQAYGGFEQGTVDGGAGTVYLRGAEEYGRLIVDNANYDAAARTLIASTVTGAGVGDVRMRNAGNLTLGTNATLTVCGSWTNEATSTFVAQTNSTVVFASTNAATVYGNRTYYNLVATNDTKTLYFEAGKTNTVLGALSLDKVTLLSTVDGAWWYVTQPTNAPQDIRRVTVKDSNAGGGQEMRAVRGDSLGHNVNWWFPPRGSSFVFR
jgi:hypothetical protein